MNKQSRISSNEVRTISARGGELINFLPLKSGWGLRGVIRERGLNRLIADLRYKDQKKFPTKQGGLMKCLEVSTDVVAFSLYDEQNRGPNAPVARQKNCVSRSL